MNKIIFNMLFWNILSELCSSEISSFRGDYERLVVYNLEIDRLFRGGYCFLNQDILYEFT